MNARERVVAAYSRMAATQRAAWISVRPEAQSILLADEIDRAVAAGRTMPLAGWTVGVKDNIDVAGLPTTAGSPDVLRRPSRSAAVVAALEDAGAIVIGKTTMDQFATGLVGTRSPYDLPHAVGDVDRISGGSSSGSAVAVASGVVDLALATDTAGSGRVPAAFNHLVGIKPTLGLLSLDGVFPAAPSFDTVAVFARDSATASRAMEVMVTAERAWPTDVFFSAPIRPRIGVASGDALDGMSAEWRAAYDRTLESAVARGAELVAIDMEPLFDVARLLYGGALVAERAFAFGEELERLGERADPTVARIVLPAAEIAATSLVGDQQALVSARSHASSMWRLVDALLLPTAPGQPTFAEVDADPVGVNSWLGTFTNFVNLLDLSALAVPAIESTLEKPRGVTLVGPAFGDLAIADIAARLGLAQRVEHFWGAPRVDLVVFGAHRRGQPLNAELAVVGARHVAVVRTAPDYRMSRLNTVPPKPGVWRTMGAGSSIVGERWSMSPAAFARFSASISSPMAIGRVTLDDGSELPGFLCEPFALEGAADITEYGDWLDYLESGL